jgi:TPM domain/TIR domain
VAGKIFISYRREDSAANALGIGQYLEHEFGRRNVFIDVDMYAGAKFPLLLEQRLASCKVMLVLIGPGWLNALDDEGQRRLDDSNDWVRLEIATALKRGVTVIPVRVAGAQLPKKGNLPSDIQGLLDHQATTVSTDGFRHQMAGLVRDIRAIPAERSQRIGLAFSSICVLAMLIAGAWAFRDKLPSPIHLPSSLFPGGSQSEDANNSLPPASRPGPEWVLYGLPAGGYLTYFKPDSIKVFPNRIAAMIRSRVDPTAPVADNKIIDRAAYQEFQEVYECSSNRMAVAKSTIFDSSGQSIYNYKWGDPEFIDLSIGTTAAPGSLAESLTALECDSELRKAYVQPQQLSEMQYISLSKTMDGKGDVFYKPENLSATNVATALVILKETQELPLASFIPQSVKDSTDSTFKFAVSRITLDCASRTITMPKTEYYSPSSALNYVVYSKKMPASAIPGTGPLEALRQVMCEPKEVEKCQPNLPSSGGALSGIYVGFIGEPGDSETEKPKVNVQVKLARNENSVTGAYYRDGVCGSVLGKVDPDGTFRFQWSWNGNAGRGRAVFADGVLTASSGYVENEEGGGSLTLFRLSPNRGDPTQSTSEQSTQPQALQSGGKLVASQPNTSEATASPKFPGLTGRIVDEARLLSEADDRELTANLKTLEDKNTDQLVVVTVPSLQGYSIEEYSLRLGKYWGVGTREKNNRVLLVVAPREHKVRIEVGRGLEGILTNKIAKEIIDKNILPQLNVGNYPAGIRDGVNAMLLVLGS